MSNDNCELAGDTGQEYIGFGCGMITSPAAGNAHVDFEMVNRPLHDGSDSIGFTPLFGVPLNPGEHTQVHMFVGIGGSAVFGSAAR